MPHRSEICNFLVVYLSTIIIRKEWESKIVTLNTTYEPGPVSTNFGQWSVNKTWGLACKYKWRARISKYKLDSGPELGLGAMARPEGWETQTPPKNSTKMLIYLSFQETTTRFAGILPFLHKDLRIIND